jgi:uncharacterized protein (DUF362 family)
MEIKRAAIVRYERPLDSVRRAVELAGGLGRIKPGSRVSLKPNIVFWTKSVPFPKWGVITTSRVVEDMVILLKEVGVDDITIVEGTVTMDPKDRETPAHAFQSLGYGVLKSRYGVKAYSIFERPFRKVELAEGLILNFNRDALESDYLIDLPVLKTHNQTKVSLGIKNLKGLLDIPSRKKCHSADPVKDLNFMVSLLATPMPPVFTLADGIYTNERGPSFDGKIRRKNILVASWDILSADMVGAKVLGFEPGDVPHLAHAAKRAGRPLDLSDIEVVGERIEDVASPHGYDFAYTHSEDGIMPTPLARQGIKGIAYHKYDLSMCTYCSGLNGLILTSIRAAWKGEPWDSVEVLTGKIMKPTPGMKKTILIGKCMYQANKDDPNIKELFAVKGCPPKAEDIVKAMHWAGIEVDPSLFEQIDRLPGFFLERYRDKPQYEEAHFRVD